MSVGAMGSGRSGAPLDSGTLDRYKPLGAFGQPVYLAHVQLKAAVRQKLGIRFANFFASPDREPRSGEIRWLADVQGPAVRWNDLPPEQQVLHALTIEELRSGFARYADDLRAMRTSRQALAFVALLDEALRVPDDSHLFLVGDQPVASFWGFSQGDGTAVDALSVAPRAPAPIPVAAVPPIAVPVAATERGWWRRWWWLALIALLLLLILPLLAWLFGLFGWFPAFDPGRRPEIGAVPPAKESPAKESPVEMPPATVEAKPEPVKPEPAIPPVAPEGTRRLDLVPDGSKRIGGVIVDPAGVVPVIPYISPTPGAPPAVTPGIKPDLLLKGEGKGVEKGVDKPDAAVIPEKPPADLPPLPPPPPPGQPVPPRPELAIPTPSANGSSNLGFLEGLWRSRQGLVDRKTGQPVEQFYRFDRSGRGEIVIRRANGTECRAPVQANVQNNALSVEELANALCPDGTSYDRARTECQRQADGRTVCNGTNSDGSTYRVGIERGN